MVDERTEQQDREHLNLLAIFNFIAAGLGVLPLMVAVPILLMMSTFTRHAASPGVPADAAIFFDILRHILVIWFLLVVFGAVLCIVNGVKLRRQENRTFSIVVAALQCIFVPLGTILGVFSLVVLCRSSVIDLYERR